MNKIKTLVAVITIFVIQIVTYTFGRKAGYREGIDDQWEEDSELLHTYEKIEFYYFDDYANYILDCCDRHNGDSDKIERFDKWVELHHKLDSLYN